MIGWYVAKKIRQQDKITSLRRGKTPVILGLIVFGLILGAGLIILTIFILSRIGWLLGGTYLAVATWAGITFLGFGVLFAGGALVVLYSWRVNRHFVPLARGHVGVGLSLMFLVSFVAGAIVLAPPSPCVDLPTGPYFIDLWAQGTGGYHTYKIPVLLVAPNGTLLAFCEARKYNADDFDDMDLVIRRSYDNGTTWTPMEILLDEGENTIGNACPVVDQDTGTIWLPYCWENDRVFVINSTDNGETWSDAREITAQVKLPGWTWYATGPTHGIQTQAGRLIIPCDHIGGGIWYSHIIYSDNHGSTWQLGGSVEGGDESTVVEAEDGRLYLNIRTDSGLGERGFSWSSDGGLTWTPMAFDATLREPSCQGNLLRLTNLTSYQTSRVLFSNPCSYYRENLTVRVSYDDCQTWTVAKVLCPGLSAYSDIAATRGPEKLICCLFERGCDFYSEKIVFARFSLTWLTTGEDTWDPRP